MHEQQRLVHLALNHEVQKRIGFWTEYAKRSWKVELCFAEYAAFDSARIADQVVIRIGLPALPAKPAAALVGGHRRVGAGVGVRKYRVAVLVERDRTPACGGSGGLGRRLRGSGRRPAATSRSGNCRDATYCCVDRKGMTHCSNFALLEAEASRLSKSCQ